VAARGLAVWRLDGVKTSVATHQIHPAPTAGEHPGYVTVKSDQAGIEARGAALQVAPEQWHAYLWCTAAPDQASRVTFHYSTGGEWRQQEDAEYPFEFSVPVASAGTPCRFYLSGGTPAGVPFRTREATIGAGVPR
jgi:hypothetical protein